MIRTPIEHALRSMARVEEALAAARDDVRDAALASAKRLQELHPEVYDIAMVLENDGKFYKAYLWHAVEFSATVTRGGVPKSFGTPWGNWLAVAKKGLRDYRDGVLKDPTWEPPIGAAELLAAYFLTVKYAEDIAELAGHAPAP